MIKLQRAAGVRDRGPGAGTVTVTVTVTGTVTRTRTRTRTGTRTGTPKLARPTTHVDHLCHRRHESQPHQRRSSCNVRPGSGADQ